MAGRFFFTAIFVLLQSFLFAQSTIFLDTNTVKEGGIIKIKLISSDKLKAGSAYFMDEKYPFFFREYNLRDRQLVYWVIVPVPLDSSGDKKLKVEYDDGKGGMQVRNDIVNVKKMKTENGSVSTGQMDDEMAAALGRENRIIRNFQNGITPLRFKLPFVMPVDSEISSHFGKTRTYDGDKGKWRHKGIDIAAVKGTPVKACADGTIKTASSAKAYGNTIIIDHGAGVYSLYFHMNRLYVKKDAKVSAGDIIGTVGTTGISTGPHLHWQVNVFKVPVNPSEFLAEF